MRNFNTAQRWSLFLYVWTFMWSCIYIHWAFPHATIVTSLSLTAFWLVVFGGITIWRSR